MQTSTRIASVCGMVKVSVVISATPMVAVSPGRAPITMPRNVAHRTVKMVLGVRNPAKAAPNWPRLSSMGALRQAHEEDAFEHQRYDDPGAETQRCRDRQPPQAFALRQLALPLEQGGEGEHEDRRRQPERQPSDQADREG